VYAGFFVGGAKIWHVTAAPAGAVTPPAGKQNMRNQEWAAGPFFVLSDWMAG
jgi:hypothetical protein